MTTWLGFGKKTQSLHEFHVFGEANTTLWDWLDSGKFRAGLFSWATIFYCYILTNWNHAIFRHYIRKSLATWRCIRFLLQQFCFPNASLTQNYSVDHQSVSHLSTAMSKLTFYFELGVDFDYEFKIYRGSKFTANWIQQNNPTDRKWDSVIVCGRTDAALAQFLMVRNLIFKRLILSRAELTA